MFGILKSAVKAASVVVDAPVSVAADIVTLGGALTDKDKPYTKEACERFVENVADIADPNK